MKKWRVVITGKLPRNRLVGFYVIGNVRQIFTTTPGTTYQDVVRKISERAKE